MKLFKRLILILVPVLLLLAGAGLLWMVYGEKVSNPFNYKKVIEITPPRGYERIAGGNPTFAAFLRSLPLKERGTKTQLYTGGVADRQPLNYAVIDLPLISEVEQCADVCMRLRSEYLFKAGIYDSIRFNDVDNGVQQYDGGDSRASFEQFMCHVYEVSNTFSLSRELERRPLADIQPGDVFVYAAADRTDNQRYGHAVMVIDVARNPKTGKKCFLLAEGNTPARNMHVVRNVNDKFNSPWFMLDEKADTLRLSYFFYYAHELKHF